MYWFQRSGLAKAKKRPPNLWLSMASCLACLAVLGVLIADLYAADDGEKSVPAGAGKMSAVKVMAADNGMPKLTVTLDGETPKVVEVLPDASIELNGAPATLEDIAPGDLVTVETDEKWRIAHVDATRRRAGIVFSAADGKIDLTTDFTDSTTFVLAADASIRLNGASAKLEDLKRGDEVKLTPNQAGEARTVDVIRISLVS